MIIYNSIFFFKPFVILQMFQTMICFMTFIYKS